MGVQGPKMVNVIWWDRSEGFDPPKLWHRELIEVGFTLKSESPLFLRPVNLKILELFLAYLNFFLGKVGHPTENCLK